MCLLHHARTPKHAFTTLEILTCISSTSSCHHRNSDQHARRSIFQLSSRMNHISIIRGSMWNSTIQPFNSIRWKMFTSWIFKSTLFSAHLNLCSWLWKVYVLQFSAQAELWQTKVLVGTFEMCARLRKCALVSANVRSLCALGLPSIKVIRHVLWLKCARFRNFCS